jgi:hypothetical protein
MGIVVQLERHLRRSLHPQKIVGRNRPATDSLEPGSQLPRRTGNPTPNAANGGAIGLDLSRDRIVIQAGNGHPIAELHGPESAPSARACQARCAPHSIDVKPACAQNAQMSKKSKFKYPTNLRWYRNQCKMTLDEAADNFGMTGQNLGKIERGLVGYQQGLIEAACVLYKCKPIDLTGHLPGLSEVLDNITESEFRVVKSFLESVRKERVA